MSEMDCIDYMNYSPTKIDNFFLFTRDMINSKTLKEFLLYFNESINRDIWDVWDTWFKIKQNKYVSKF